MKIIFKNYNNIILYPVNVSFLRFNYLYLTCISKNDSLCHKNIHTNLRKRYNFFYRCFYFIFKKNGKKKPLPFILKDLICFMKTSILLSVC